MTRTLRHILYLHPDNISAQIVMSKNKLKIGEFSRLGRVTVRALRHYEEIDLLAPEIVDRETGYRYYSASQLPTLRMHHSPSGASHSKWPFPSMQSDRSMTSPLPM